jgi:hypothetical protein
MQNKPVNIRDTPEGGAQVLVADVSFQITLPLRFIQLVGENTSVNVSGDVTLAAFRGSESFELKRGVVLKCRELNVAEHLLRLGGSDISLDPDSVRQPPNLDVALPKSADESFKFSVSGALAGRYPWSTVATETARIEGEIEDRWTDLIERCALKASAQGLPALTQDGQPVDDEGAANWVKLQYPFEFPKLINEIVSSGLGQLQVMEASGRPKYRLRVEFGWNDLLSAARSPARAPERLQALVRSLRGV